MSMKKSFFIGIGFFFFLITAPPAFSGQVGGKVFKVLTYNIHGLPGKKNNRARFVFIGEKLSQMRESAEGPDVVLIQEAFSLYSRLMVERSGYPFVAWGPQNSISDLMTDAWFVGSGLVILSRYPIKKIDQMSFSTLNCAGWDCLSKKGVQFVQVKPFGWKQSISVMNTHMNSNKGSGVLQEIVDRAKFGQIQELNVFLQKNKPFIQGPFVFAGDFNLNPKLNHWADLLHVLGMQNSGTHCLEKDKACLTSGPTSPDSFVLNTMDQQFFQSNNQSRIRPIKIFKNMDDLFMGETASDHLGYQVNYLIE